MKNRHGNERQKLRNEPELPGRHGDTATGRRGYNGRQTDTQQRVPTGYTPDEELYKMYFLRNEANL